MLRIKHARIINNAIKIQFSDGLISYYHQPWLRDNCSCSICRHSVTKQRLIDFTHSTLSRIQYTSSTLNVEWVDRHPSARNIYPTATGRILDPSATEQRNLATTDQISPPPTVLIKDEGIKAGQIKTDVAGQRDCIAAIEGIASLGKADRIHSSSFALEWLRCNSYHPKINRNQHPSIHQPSILEQAKVLWKYPNPDFARSLDYESIIKSDKALLQWIENILIHGIGIVKNVPVTLKDTQALCERITFIRNTHYGAFWDFTSDMAKKDTAYTTLPVHTDSTYFTDPIGVQLFHLLQHDGTGGAQIYVDAFACAVKLRAVNPKAFEVLCRVHISCTIENYKPLQRFPVFTLDASSGLLIQVRWNNNDRDILDLAYNDMGDFYDAIAAWMDIIAGHEVDYKLEPGTVVAMDNHRILHGRREFTGLRRMSGCYLGMDDVRSRVRELEALQY